MEVSIVKFILTSKSPNPYNFTQTEHDYVQNHVGQIRGDVTWTYLKYRFCPGSCLRLQ